MDSDNWTVFAICGALVTVIGALLTVTYYDTAAQRQCREKLATAPGQYRSAPDITQLCR